MMYQIFKWLFYPTLKAYFRNIYIHNAGVVPKKGPVIFAVNHTSAFMDPIVIAVFSSRILHFLARGEAFNSKFSKAFYAKMNMLPVYRPETTPGEVHKNKFVFQACHVHLKNNKALIIFPEGFSKTERRLRPIKPGLARIAFGASVENNFELDIQVVPIGINYSNAHKFDSDLFVNHGDPIAVKGYQSLFEQNEKEAIRKLTDDVRLGLEKCTVVIEDEKLELFIHQLETLFGAQGTSYKAKSQAMDKFQLSQQIVAAVHEVHAQKPAEYKNVEMRMAIYMGALKRLKIKDQQLKEKQLRLNLIRRVLYFVLGLPLFVYGLLWNLIPFRLVSLLSKKIPVREDFIGSLKISIGMFLFLIVYLLETSVVGFLFGFYWAMLFLAMLYPSGLFAIHYLKQMKGAHETYIFIAKKSRKKGLFEKLKEERMEIIDQLHALGIHATES